MADFVVQDHRHACKLRMPTWRRSASVIEPLTWLHRGRDGREAFSEPSEHLPSVDDDALVLHASLRARTGVLLVGNG